MSDEDAWRFARPADSEADMFIQWKGTSVCLDLTCQCGEECHYDGDFAYALKCPTCGAVYELGTQVTLKRVDGDGFHSPRLMSGDDWS